MSSSPVRGPVLRDLSPNCRPSKGGGGWLGDSDSIIIALSEDEVVASENVSLAPSLEAEITRSTSCVPHPGTPSLPHPRSSPQAASPSVASMTPTRQRIMSSNACSRTPTSTPRLKTLAPVPTLRRLSTTPTSLKASRPTATTPTSIATHPDIQARHSQWEQRRAEERRRREEENSVLSMLASVDRGNEEHKLARQSLKKVDESSSQNPHPTPLFESPSELGGASSMAYQRPSALAAAQSSPVPIKPREGTLSPQDRREKEAHYHNIKSSDAEDAGGDNDDDGATNISPVNDGTHPPVDVCAETLKGHDDASSASNHNIKHEDQVTPTKATSSIPVAVSTTSRTPRSLPPPHTVSPAALTPSRQREETRGPLVSPQRPTRSLTPSECMVAKAVSQSLSQQQAFNNNNNSSPFTTTSMKGCSITVSPLSSKAVSPIPTTTTTAAVEVQAPIKVEMDVPTTPQTYIAKPACNSVASGTPLLSVSTATQMTPQLVVVPSATTTSNNEAEEDDDDWEVPSSQVTTTTTLIKKESSEEAEGEGDIVEKEGSAAMCSSSSHAVVVPDKQDDPSSVKNDKMLLPLGGAATIGLKRSRDTSSQTSYQENRSHSRATTAHSSRVASEPQEEEEELIQPEPKVQSEKLLKIAARKKAILSQSPIPRVNEQQPTSSRPERELTRKERKRQIDQEHRERLRVEREAQERRAKASSRNSGQKKKKNTKKK